MEMRHMRITKYEHSKHEPATNTMEKPKTSREKFLSHLLAGPPPRQSHLLAGPPPPDNATFFYKKYKKTCENTLKK